MVISTAALSNQLNQLSHVLASICAKLTSLWCCYPHNTISNKPLVLSQIFSLDILTYFPITISDKNTLIDVRHNFG